MYAKKNISLGVIEGIDPDHSIKGQSQFRCQTCEGLQLLRKKALGKRMLYLKNLIPVFMT